eukprot:6213526-Pleurochrysis_carterae.AAC.4
MGYAAFIEAMHVEYLVTPTVISQNGTKAVGGPRTKIWIQRFCNILAAAPASTPGHRHIRPYRLLCPSHLLHFPLRRQQAESISITEGGPTAAQFAPGIG